jgi:hypothetical protein
MHMFVSILVLAILLLPGVILAQTNLINLPIRPQAGENGFTSYINLLYALSISAAALLAVIKIIIAGVKYMLTDVVTSKGAAIQDIKGALLGLLLIIGAVLILTVINPQLLRTTLEFDPQPMPDVPTRQSSVRPAAGAGTGANAGTGGAGAGASAGTGGASAGAGAGTGSGSGAGAGAGSVTAQFDPSCIRGAGTRTQGTVTNQYFNVTACGFTNIQTARTYIANEICRPNAVFNAGNDTYYCRQ